MDAIIQSYASRKQSYQRPPYGGCENENLCAVNSSTEPASAYLMQSDHNDDWRFASFCVPRYWGDKSVRHGYLPSRWGRCHRIELRKQTGATFR